MNIVSLGKIRVMNPGTPVPLSPTPLLVSCNTNILTTRRIL